MILMIKMTLENIEMWQNIQKVFLDYKPEIQPSKIFLQDAMNPTK